jgi:hypothetical protein
MLNFILKIKRFQTVNINKYIDSKFVLPTLFLIIFFHNLLYKGIQDVRRLIPNVQVPLKHQDSCWCFLAPPVSFVIMFLLLFYL